MSGGNCSPGLSLSLSLAEKMRVTFTSDPISRVLLLFSAGASERWRFLLVVLLQIWFRLSLISERILLVASSLRFSWRLTDASGCCFVPGRALLTCVRTHAAGNRPSLLSLSLSLMCAFAYCTLVRTDAYKRGREKDWISLSCGTGFFVLHDTPTCTG